VGVAVIDLHCHPLPALDDGPPDDAAALALLRRAAADGTRTVAATPHVDRRFGLGPEEIATAVAHVRALVERTGITVTVVPGAEIALDRLVDLRSDQLAALSLGGGRCLLVECPLSTVAGEFEWPAQRLLQDGVQVLLGHPERCPDFQRSPRRLRALIDAGAMVQLTAGSLRGEFGAACEAFALELARGGLAHNVASDAHDAVRRPPGLRDARELLGPVLPGGADEAAWLVESAPAAILMGVELPPRPC
jgi:protein-tyrosine phosphatase